LSFVYSPDNGQYIILYIGLLLALYGNTSLSTQLLFSLFSFNLYDEITGDSGAVDLSDYFEAFLIIFLGYFNYRNLRLTTR